jgi:uncharacterized protein (TIGR02996 family)
VAKKKFQKEELSLLAAVHASPKDDTVRLAYADWLEENGEPDYAEFIRWQVQNAEEVTIPRPSAKTLERWKAEPPASLAERMAQRLALNFGRWARPFLSDSEAHVRVFFRGLPLCRPFWVYSQQAEYDRLLRMNPRLRFQLGLDETALDFLAHPVFIRADIVTLGPSVVGGNTPEAAVRTLAAWPRLGSLRTVILYSVQDPRRLKTLFPPTISVETPE